MSSKSSNTSPRRSSRIVQNRGKQKTASKAPFTFASKKSKPLPAYIIGQRLEKAARDLFQCILDADDDGMIDSRNLEEIVERMEQMADDLISSESTPRTGNDLEQSDSDDDDVPFDEASSVSDDSFVGEQEEGPDEDTHHDDGTTSTANETGNGQDNFSGDGCSSSPSSSDSSSSDDDSVFCWTPPPKKQSAVNSSSTTRPHRTSKPRPKTSYYSSSSSSSSDEPVRFHKTSPSKNDANKSDPKTPPQAPQKPKEASPNAENKENIFFSSWSSDEPRFHKTSPSKDDANKSDPKTPPEAQKPTSVEASPNEENKENNFFNSGSFRKASRTSKRRQSSKAAFSSSNSGATTKKSYTKEEQQDFANKVLAANLSGKGSHYKVFDLPTSASSEDVKKAYRKTILRLHPDKNKAPRATEAFRAAKSAYDVLKSPAKRSDYNYRCNISNNTTASSNAAPQGSGPGNSSHHTSSDPFATGSTLYNTIPAGTPITVVNLDQKGEVLRFDADAKKYVVIVEDEWNVIKVECKHMFQNIDVDLRKNTGPDIRTYTLMSSYPADSGIGCIYKTLCKKTQKIVFLCSSDFTVPKGTIVRLEGLLTNHYNGKYGKVVDWDEETLRYTVQLSTGAMVRVTDTTMRFDEADNVPSTVTNSLKKTSFNAG